MDDSIRDEIISKRPKISPILWVGFGTVLVIAIFVFIVYGSKQQYSHYVWQIFLVNFVFWTGLSQAGIIFSCILRLTQARWGRPMLRISESIGAFLPVCFILL